MGRKTAPFALRKSAKSPYWFVRFTTSDGRRIELSTRCKTKREAWPIAADLWEKESKAQSAAVKQGPIFDLVELWLDDVEELKSSGTYEKYKSYAQDWLLRWPDVRLINAASVQSYISSQLKTLSPVTVRKRTSALRQFFKWCVSRDYVDSVPRWQDPPGKSDYESVCLEPEEAERLIACLPERGRRGEPIRSFYRVMWATSLRRGSLAKIRWEDIDWNSGTLLLRASTDKAKNQRRIPLTDDALDALRSMGRGVGLIFGYRDFRTQLKRAAIEAGLPGDKIARLNAHHCFRHSRLTDLYSRSRNISGIMHLSGHTTLITAKRYLHESAKASAKLLEELDERSDRGSERGSFESGCEIIGEI